MGKVLDTDSTEIPLQWTPSNLLKVATRVFQLGNVCRRVILVHLYSHEKPLVPLNSSGLQKMTAVLQDDDESSAGT